MQQKTTHKIGLRQAINIAVRVRRLERSRKMKLASQLEALTDPTLIQRMTETPSQRETREGIQRMAKALTRGAFSISEMVENQKRARRNAKVYSKNRNIVQ